MANSGRDTNGSQFFITFKKLAHLDNKHTVFGKITNGFLVLDEMEKIETDAKNGNQPLKEIKIDQIVVLNNPYREIINEILHKDFKILSENHMKEQDAIKLKNQQELKVKRQSNEIGKYM